MPVVLDLFAGAGGFSHGFQRAGFDVIAGVDFDHDAIETFKLNHPGSLGIEADISKITPAYLSDLVGRKTGEIDVIIGGPPCQGFSRNRAFSHNNGDFVDDPRNQLYWHFYDFIDYFLPKFVVMENVPEILSVKNGYFKKSIHDRLTNAGYRVEMGALYANEYGVPQFRKRAFILASRDNKPAKLPLPSTIKGIKAGDRTPKSKSTAKSKPLPSGLFDMPESPSVWDAISDLYGRYSNSREDAVEYESKPANPYQSSLRSNSGKVFNHFEWQLSENQLRRIRLLREGQGMEHLPEELKTKDGFGSAYRRMHSQAQALTITTWMFHPGSGMFTHPFADRVITIREAARLQSFHDDFIFTGSYHSQCRQVGNSVAPLVAKSIADSLMEIL